MVSHIRLGSPVALHSESKWFSGSARCGVHRSENSVPADMKVGATVC
jgi:hypothetical protein